MTRNTALIGCVLTAALMAAACETAQTSNVDRDAQRPDGGGVGGVATDQERSRPTPQVGRDAQRPGDSMLVERSHVTMGSELRVAVWSADEPKALAAIEAVFDEFDRLDRLLSVWKDESDIVRLNAAAGRHPVGIHADTREVLQLGRQVGDWTGGKFDITFAALSGLWKFDHDQDNRIPDPRAVAERLPLVDYRAVEIDPLQKTAFIARPGVQVHLGGIGKGFAVDRGVRLLRSRGLTNFLIQSGGDMFAGGRRGDRPWRVAIRDPRGDGNFASIDLEDAAISTSSDAERYFIQDGRRYHHILDPDTGQPARLNRSVTIFAQRSYLADGLATGVFVLGPDKGMELIQRFDVEGVIVSATNDVLVSPGLRGRLALLAPPHDAP
jgi:thiamine biosynthesis lipoprotein